MPSIASAAGPGSAPCSGSNIFGIDPQRDQILLQSIGDQGVQSQALESGTVDVVFVDSVYSKLLKQKGMNIIAESSELKQPLVSQSTIVPDAFLRQHPDVAEGYLKGEIEGIAFAVAPKNKPAVIKILMRRLRVDARPRRKATRICCAASTANRSLRSKACATCNGC